MDTTIPCRARSSMNIARYRNERVSFAVHRGDTPNVRVLRVHTYSVELQIRTGPHYANATLSKEEALAVAAALTEGANDIKPPAPRDRQIIGEAAEPAWRVEAPRIVHPPKKETIDDDASN